MVKSYVAFLEGLYTALLAECMREYPQLTSEWKLDHSSLRSAVKSRGIRFLTIDLPSFGKHLDGCLSSGVLTCSGVPMMGRRSARSPIPRLFGGLALRIFDSKGVLRSDADVHSVRLLRLLSYAAKKVRMECCDETVYKTVSEYVSIEEECRLPTFRWDDDVPDFGPCRVHLSDELDGDQPGPLFSSQAEHCGPSGLLQTINIVQQVADTIVGGFGLVSYDKLRPKHGPGAVADLDRYKVSKYTFPTWPARLEALFPYEEYANANYNIWEEAFDAFSLYQNLLGQQCYPSGDDTTQLSCVARLEAPCELIAVPKTQKGPRLIAKEPTCNQWMQQALKGDLESKVAKSALRLCIDFKDQSLSGFAALRASETGLDATIDLSSASDRLSTWCVERFFRSNIDLLNAWHACRTRYLRNEIDGQQPKYIKLRKFAPAGSALTFPVQSCIYAIAAIGTLISKRAWGVDRASIELAARRVRVFGDDLIVPVDICEELTQVLTYLGLKVNTAKTYKEGNFRESCGVDGFRGQDVTPAYVLEPYSESRPESLDSVVQSSNNFYRRGYWIVADWLKSTVPQRISKEIPVVGCDSGAFGWVCVQGFRGTSTSRWNPNLKRVECRTLQPITRSSRRSVQGWANLLQYKTEAPDPLNYVKWSSGVDSRPASRLGRRWVPVPFEFKWKRVEGRRLAFG